MAVGIIQKVYQEAADYFPIDLHVLFRRLQMDAPSIASLHAKTPKKVITMNL